MENIFMYEILYKMKIFGYHQFEIKTSLPKSEVMRQLHENIETEKRIFTRKRFHGQIDPQGFQFEHYTNRRLPVYGIINEGDGGAKISVTIKEPTITIISMCLLVIFVLIISFIRYKTLPITLILGLLFTITFIRVVLYILFRLDVASVKRSLMKMFR